VYFALATYEMQPPVSPLQEAQELFGDVSALLDIYSSRRRGEDEDEQMLPEEDEEEEAHELYQQQRVQKASLQLLHCS
jgi:hypothetical protein